MRVFMLGWEFPPQISGGLGVACYGLTRAMSRRGTEVTFVLPQPITAAHAGPVRLLSPPDTACARPVVRHAPPPAETHTERADQAAVTAAAPPAAAAEPVSGGDPGFERVSFRSIPSQVRSSYAAVWSNDDAPPPAPATATPPPPPAADPAADTADTEPSPQQAPVAAGGHGPSAPAANGSDARDTAIRPADYQGDLVLAAQKYARHCLEIARHERFDVIHAHDWLTFPAGIALAAISGKPLVVHIHSTEYDRAGEGQIHEPIAAIERRGVAAADRVVTVSKYTAAVLSDRYGVAPQKVEVVYNGIDLDEAAIGVPQPAPAFLRAVDGGTRATNPPLVDGQRVVLFLGRLTSQKGPAYFIEAAEKVLAVLQDVHFVVAGSGAELGELIERTRAADIADRVTFTGFLKGPDVARLFRAADVFVMPSVSEPFGLAPLEAISHDVPVIISNQSGVAEVLPSALKADFWDTDAIAEQIIGLLNDPAEARKTHRKQAEDLASLTWDRAAERVAGVYDQVVAEAHP